MNRDRLYHIYGKLQHLIAPSLRYAQDVYEETLRKVIGSTTKWLDLGCGHRVLPYWREREEQIMVSRAAYVVGLDYDWLGLSTHRSIRLRVRGDISALPFRDNNFDLATANMVVEHLATPSVQFAEVYRVLNPGGLFVFHTPNAHGYTTFAARLVPEHMKAPLISVLDGRPSRDVFKTHYKANTESRIKQLAETAGFEVVQIRFVASTAKFAVVAPLALIELFWIRLLLSRPFRKWRTNLIVTLRKPQQTAIIQ